MEFGYLSNTIEVKTVSEDARKGVFEIEGLYAGYGLTIGNGLRRTLLSSLPGAAVTQIKIKGVSHEFSTLPGVKEDMVELSLNFKKLRFQMHMEEPQTLLLHVKGEKEITGADIKTTSEVKLMNPEEVLAHTTAKGTDLEIEVRVERGLGYSPVELRKSTEKLPIGAVAIDALFSPVSKVNYTIENMRVGERTDYNRLRLEIETDGSVSPSAALHKAGNILKDHFEKVGAVTVQDFDEATPAAPATKKSKKSSE